MNILLLFTIVLGALLVLDSSNLVQAVELTFELPDSAKQCFHEDIHQGVESTVEFQVVTGGKYDVDMTLTGPRGEVLYQGVKKQFDTFKWTPSATGTYTMCFSNEFSTFSHKLVYFDFQVGEETPLPGTQEHIKAMTKVSQTQNDQTPMFIFCSFRWKHLQSTFTNLSTLFWITKRTTGSRRALGVDEQKS